jgi:glycosyltransferase involved in cell wall biosynthesis
MKISVIVPAFNEEKLIAETLRSIQTASHVFVDAGWQTELIVCDNNSTDRTAELVRAAGAQVVFEPVNQIARARNTGARAASGDWLLFIDADSHPDAALFADVVRAIQSGRYIAGGATLDFSGDAGWARVGVMTWNWISRIAKYLAGAFIFCEAGAFRELGGFNEKLFVSEEIDLSKRLRKLARKRRKSLIILHEHSLSTSPRKVHLYSLFEYLRFAGGIVLKFGKPMKDPKACFPWYDGRR